VVQFIGDKDGVKALLLSDLGPVVLLRVASVLPGREPQFESYSALYVGALSSSLQLVPAIKPS
jgi:hypothetical protein